MSSLSGSSNGGARRARTIDSPRRTAWPAMLLALVCAVAPQSWGALQLPPGGTPPKPDLKVRVELVKDRRPDGVRVLMRFHVMNVGAGPAAASTLGAWCLPRAGGACPALDGPYEQGPAVEPGATGVVRLPTPALAAGAAVVVLGPATRPWPNGNYTIRAMADVLLTVAETIEANNFGQAETNVP